MDVNKLKTFYYVALEGSYKKASVYLGVTPSYICKHIKSLEDSLKSKLFTRSHGSQIPTDKGQELLDYVHVIINQVEKIKEITNVDNKQDDIIRIVTTTGVTSIWLIKKLKELGGRPASYPTGPQFQPFYYPQFFDEQNSDIILFSEFQMRCYDEQRISIECIF